MNEINDKLSNQNHFIVYYTCGGLVFLRRFKFKLKLMAIVTASASSKFSHGVIRPQI